MKMLVHACLVLFTALSAAALGPVAPAKGRAMGWPGLASPGPTSGKEAARVVWVFFSSHGGQAERDWIQATDKALWRRVARGQEGRLDQPDLRVNQAFVRSVRECGVKLRTQSRWFNAVSVEGGKAQLDRIRSLPFVREVRPVAMGRRKPAPRTVAGANPQSRLDYGPSHNQLAMLGVPQAHDAGLSGAGIRVLMLDTGFYTDHVAFGTGRILGQWDFINQDGQTQNEEGDPVSQHRHGTATASALGGHWPGQLYGPAFNCQFLLAKTEDTSSETPVEEDYYVAALEWGEAQGADVASGSLGYTDWYQWEDLDGHTALVTQAADMAVALGVSVVVSAGNSRGDAWGHIGTPADAFGVLSVGAVDESGQLTWFSSPGPTFDGRIKPEVSAQGLNVAAAGWDNPTNLRYFAGTSLSCPLVAGCAALLLEAHPLWTPAQVRAALMSTADRASMPDNDYGWGIVDLPAALAAFPEPGPVAISLAGDQVVLNWPDNDYASYRIYRADHAWGPFTFLGETSQNTWSGPRELTQGSAYFRVQGLVSLP